MVERLAHKVWSGTSFVSVWRCA